MIPTDLTVSYGATTDDDALQLTDTAGKYVEIGERYMKFFLANGNAETEYDGDGPDNAAIVSDGVVDLDHANVNTIAELKGVLNGAHSGTPADDGSGADNFDTSNLLKGIYKMTGSAVNIPCVGDTDETLTAFNNLKTVSLKIANNNTPIPARTLGQDGSTVKWLQHSKIRRGKADVTLDLTMTSEDETLYDMYKDKTTIPLVRLDLGTNGSIALTNGTITSFSRPLTPGGEIVDTMSIKFRGSGDYKDFSSYAISADWTL